MLVYMRHGKTALNQGGNQERLRGWLPVPLAPEGVDQANATGKRLAQALPNVSSFEASDLHRTMQTAGIVGKYLGLAATPNADIRDWNTGKLAGQKVEDVLPTLKYFIAHPDEPTPDGEALNTYLQRFEPLMRAKVASPGVHLVIGHARGATILEGIADATGGQGGAINPKYLYERPNVEPGGVLIIDRNWNTTIDNPSERDGEHEG